MIGIHHIESFIKKHPEAASGLRRWQKLMIEGDYKSMTELRKTFPTADYVAGRTIFNVGGNKVRTITILEYGIRQVLITHVLSHKDYDLDKWKGRLR